MPWLLTTCMTRLDDSYLLLQKQDPSILQILLIVSVILIKRMEGNGQSWLKFSTKMALIFTEIWDFGACSVWDSRTEYFQSHVAFICKISTKICHFGAYFVWYIELNISYKITLSFAKTHKKLSLWCLFHSRHYMLKISLSFAKRKTQKIVYLVLISFETLHAKIFQFFTNFPQ